MTDTNTAPRRWSDKALGLPFFDVGVLPGERFSGSLIKAAWIEFVCMLLFLYFTTGAICFGCHSSDVSTSSSGTAGGASVTPVDCFLNSSRVLTIATSFGFSIFVLVYASAAFSGGHLNPAVTLAFLITKKLSVVRAIMYWIAQIGGAIIGSYLVKYTDLTGFASAKGGTNRLLPGLPPSAAWLMETILTFSLIFAIFVATDAQRGQSTSHIPILAPAAIGFTVFVCHLAAIALDGCSINPARSFGPAVTAAAWTDHWVFWVGPFSGAIIAALTYEFTARPSHDPLLTVDRDDDTAQTEVIAKLPGYTGASGLPSKDEAHKILAAKQQAGNDTARELSNENVSTNQGTQYSGGNISNGRVGNDQSSLGPRMVGHNMV